MSEVCWLAPTRLRHFCQIYSGDSKYLSENGGMPSGRLLNALLAFSNLFTTLVANAGVSHFLANARICDQNCSVVVQAVENTPNGYSSQKLKLKRGSSYIGCTWPGLWDYEWYASTTAWEGLIGRVGILATIKDVNVSSTNPCSTAAELLLVIIEGLLYSIAMETIGEAVRSCPIGLLRRLLDLKVYFGLQFTLRTRSSQL